MVNHAGMRVAALSLALVLLLLPGCLGKLKTEPSQAQMASWDYGPFPENYKEIVMASPKLRTLDAGTPNYEFQGAPQKKWDNEGAGYVYGWAGTVKSFGNKSGTTTWEYYIRNGQLVRMYQMNDQRFFRF